MTRTTFIVLLLSAALSVALPAGEGSRWAEEHPEARKKLHNVFAQFPRLRDELAGVAEEDPEMLREYVEFLAAKGDRNTKDFADKYGRKARDIKKIHEKMPEAVRAFREWIRDFEKGSVALARNKAALREVLAERRERR
ncbi:MAG TPA: hypothetical protein VEK08_13230 [Planctomycetota bacterium]|nr:hypothetical protein [Planctomycetota bacterium]